MSLTHNEQAETFLRILSKRTGPIQTNGQIYKAVLTWLCLPLVIDGDLRVKIVTELEAATGLTREQLTEELRSQKMVQLEADEARPQEQVVVNGRSNAIEQRMEEAFEDEQRLWKLLPKGGFFADYAQYTLESEAPLAYHVFCALAGVAATVNRRVFLDMGNHKLYPPFGIFLLGPSGVKKTSAGDIIVSLLRESGLTPIYAEKLTPEALIDGMRGGNATGVVYAPEMTVLISKQKYMESIIPLLTRFMDSPDIWNSGTIMRGKAELRDVAITCLMCSTIDWFVDNTPEALFGGGFIARNVMVMQQYSCRIKPLPPTEDKALRNGLLLHLARMFELNGPATLDKETHRLHVDWYMKNKFQQEAVNELFETYYARKPAHLLRVAMCLHLSTHYDLVICPECWDRAFHILAWMESHFDLLSGKMFKTGFGEDQDLVVRMIERAGGQIQHSALLRKLSYKFGGPQLRVIISNLKEMNVLEEVRSAMGHSYRLRKGQND